MAKSWLSFGVELTFVASSLRDGSLEVFFILAVRGFVGGYLISVAPFTLRLVAVAGEVVAISGVAVSGDDGFSLSTLLFFLSLQQRFHLKQGLSQHLYEPFS
jgi:hypothetical protein